MEYRIIESRRLQGQVLVTPSFTTRKDAENHLKCIVSNNTDPMVTYKVAYVKIYNKPDGTVTFGEFSEPDNIPSQ